MMAFPAFTRAIKTVQIYQSRLKFLKRESNRYR